ncbi:MAG: DUF3300 domain-containing protein [Alphaproteobacteria bacterium]|nr:DUF3300 domain-containing protein [Alphaproteobacteria bacterium]
MDPETGGCNPCSKSRRSCRRSAAACKGKEKGTLKSTSQQTVKTQTTQSTTYIVVVRTNPQVVYVPVYNPTIVYGVWPYPAYPPYYWYPVGYVARRAVWFGAGVAVGAAVWGNTNWRHGDVNINVNKYNNFNRTNVRTGQWQHNPKHRGAVPYRNSNVAKRYGRAPRSANCRQAYRGRTATGTRGARRSGQASRSRTGRRYSSTSGMNRGRAYDGVGRGQQTRRYSNRGQNSWSGSRKSYGGGRSGYSRGGGGFSGRRGGGRRR